MCDDRVMKGAGAPMKILLVFGIALRFHHHVHGPPVDYVALASASAASWIGLPGPGEPVLIAAGVFAARHKLDIGSVVGIAFLSAAAGGIAGWLIGMKAGRVLLVARGPFKKARATAVRRGDEVFERYPVLAIILTPSWIAGIHRVGAVKYNVVNAVTALLWAAIIGLGAYFAGPAIEDLVDDFGTVTTVALGVLVVVVIAGEVLRRRRRRKRREAAAVAAPP